jgi:hypothetical protein
LNALQNFLLLYRRKSLNWFIHLIDNRFRHLDWW